MKKSNNKPLPAIIGALVVQLCVGILYLWSVFKTPIVTAFNWNASAAGMVSSYMIFAFVFGNLIGGFINDKKGPKLTCFLGVILFSLGVGLTAFLTEKTISLIYVTYAVMGGLGSGFAYGACISCIQKWLPHRRGLASGLACGAFGLSTVVFTPLSNALMNVFATDGVVNFTPVFLILAGVFLVLGLVASSFVSLPGEEYIKSLNLPEKAVSGGENYTLGQSMKQPAFWCLFFSIFFINGTWNLCVPLIKDLGMTRGLAESAAIACVSFTGVTNALGRIIMSTLSDKLGRANTMYILSGLTFVGAVLMTFITGYGYFATIAIIAFAYGGPSALNAALCTDLFGAKHSGTNYGVAMLALGFSSIFFNWVSNNILKATVENVTSTFIMGAVTALIPVVLMIIIQRTLNKRDTAKAES
ncbi:MAG: OFA family MFS transporter [Oscillospiraceae bacterium]|nr:OFA family MFS transporter [Oscillospiraceae bacterium]